MCKTCVDILHVYHSNYPGDVTSRANITTDTVLSLLAPWKYVSVDLEVARGRENDFLQKKRHWKDTEHIPTIITCDVMVEETWFDRSQTSMKKTTAGGHESMESSV